MPAQRNPNFIQSATKNPGALHRDLGVPRDQRIPKRRLAAAAHRPGKVGARARFAELLASFHH